MAVSNRSLVAAGNRSLTAAGKHSLMAAGDRSLMAADDRSQRPLLRRLVRMHAPSAGPWASRDDIADRERAGGQVGVPHEVKGESIYAFVTLMDGLEMTPALQKELKQVTVARSRLHFSHYPLRGLFQRISDSHPRHTFLCIVTAATCTNTRTRGFARTAGVG